ncbi:filamentous hemagglutinin family protein [Caulobacter sp. CCNWLY153]|uniref:filamentous haemagglutinin family protein n=1 Tax=unclassified Caulobacter TaxID=2648921 RepID=UPI002FF36105
MTAQKNLGVAGARRARAQLLHGASLLVFAAFGGTAWGQVASLRGATSLPAATGAGAPSVAVPVVPGLSTGGQTAAQQAAAARALQNASRAQQAVTLAAQAQAAARQASGGATVPNGLAHGGLAPVANPTSNNAGSGLSLWTGANLPTQTTKADGSIQVDVKQTASRAVLSWETFNVGAQTTLNFDQSQNGVAKPDWVVLNRVVGQLDPATGRRTDQAPAPSQILGSIKAQGTVLVINQNGVIFGKNAQINTGSLLASTLEIGRQTRVLNGATQSLSLADRNEEFLNFGLLGAASQVAAGQAAADTLSAQQINVITNESRLEGAITVEAGAQITSSAGGFVILAGPKITNAGTLTADRGQVSLAAGRTVRLEASTGAAGTATPDIRGLKVSTSVDNAYASALYVENKGVIQSSEGYASLMAARGGAVINSGVITATTSVARNGYVELQGGQIRLAPTSIIAITPDDDGTIPQDFKSLSDFKTSRITIGDATSSVEMASGSLIYAPSAKVGVGAAPGIDTTYLDQAGNTSEGSRIFIDSGATIDVAGLKNVLISASRNSVTISPVKGNELADTPALRNSFLRGATLYLDPRLSGVRDDGFAWIGSPLVSAASYAQQVGITASELMTKGGDVTLGTAVTRNSSGVAKAPDVIIKKGAQIDISGGWVNYQGGMVRTTKLVDISGAIVDISQADPNGVYVGIYSGFVHDQPRFNEVRTYANPLLTGARYQDGYSEGRDAGALTIKTSQPLLEGTVYADAFPGLVQRQDAQLGTGATTVHGDKRRVQAAPSQLPVGGLLSIQELGLVNGTSTVSGGGDIRIVDGETPTLANGLRFGQSVSIDNSGNLLIPVRPEDSLPSLDTRKTLTLGADTLAQMGLGQLNLTTSGSLTVERDAEVVLSPGGVFSAATGGRITVDGSIAAASGLIDLTTYGMGSIFEAVTPKPGDYDIVVNGSLSTAGLWINDYGASGEALRGSAYTGGGKVSLNVAARKLLYPATTSSASAPETNVDLSGSILLDGEHSLIDVSSGGYVTSNGGLMLTARGGDVSLTNDTTYFQIGYNPTGTPEAGGWPGIRLDGLPTTVNPGSMDAKVSIGRGAIRAHGFGGGGTFSLTTPSIAFGEGRALTGTNLGLDFFSQSGFAAYDIKSYGTSLTPNTLSGLGGYNAVLSTQTLTIGNGQSLNLTQSRYSIRPTTAQTAALIALRTGGRVSDVLTAATPSEAWDQLGVNLTFGGLVELKVAQGGQIIGAPGSTIGASKILNQGLIRLHGGKVVQSATLPAFYAGATTFPVTAARSLSEIFSTRADGSVDPNAISRIDPTRTNAQVARGAVYLLGELDAEVGMRLDAGSVTDLSGISIRNPYASAVTDGRQVVTGRLWNGGTLQTATARSLTGTIVGVTPAIGGVSPYTNSDTQPNLREDTVGLALDAAAGAVIDLSGASDVYDQPSAFGNYAPATQWSNGGVLNMGAGGNIAGATIRADGGSAQAAGGVLALPDLVLTSDASAAPTRNTLTAQAIEAAGFDTLVVQGSLRGEGDVDLKLGSAFYLTSKTWDGVTSLNDATYRQSLSPVIGANGSLRIKAAYISLGGAFQSLATPNVGVPGAGEVVFDAGAMDVGGAVLFDRSVAKARFNVAGDLRFTGVAPYETAFAIPGAAPAPSLSGHLAVNGDLSLVAGQIYATTGSTYAVTSTAGDGLIAIGRSSATTPATPYSAGSNLSFQASSIVQGGVLRAPLGTLTLGAQSPLTRGGVQFAPATGSVILADGGLTSVSAGGLSIPYGVTTDQKEYYFSPTGADPLKGPPAGALNLAGRDIVTQGGAKIDLSGGGDVYAYEFIPGVGGSRDVLSQYNPDAFSGNGGYQYADKRQVYAIVPGLSDGGVAAFDPIYSSNYADLYSATAVGRRVYLSGGPGFAAGWYTLLPAQYATLPGGMRVVEESGLNAAPGLAQSGLDGSILVSGRFGGLNGQEDSALRMFTVQSQSVFRSYSNIALTSATLAFSDQALKAGTVAPRLPTDAARLTIQPVDSLTLAGTFDTTPAKGGRGAQADISGADIVIVSDVGAPIAGRIQLDADQLSNLNVDSLLIGGTRTDNADGTTTIKASASRITVSNDSGHALAAPDLLLAVDNGGAVIIDDGATVIARGATSDTRTGAYLLDGSATNLTGKGALVRVSNGAARTVARTNMDAGPDTALLRVGAATLTGASVLLNSSRDLTIDPQATLSATDLGLSAAEMHFSETPEGLGGLVVTARLAKALGAAKRLTLSTPSVIDFAAGDYAFGDLVVDAGGLAVAPGDGSVKLTAGSLTLANAHAKLAGCVTACGAGTLAISTQNLAFGSGDLQVLGAGGGVSIAARDGFFYQGRGSLNVGSAALTISTPLIADRAAPIGSDGKAIIPTLALVSSGAVSILGGGAAAAPEGVAGASLTIDGATISVAQTRIRASAGVLKLTARDDLTIGAGAILATPGYVKSFGDAADPYLVHASGGALTLTSVNGDIDLAEGSTLSVGGGMGEAGDLTLNAANGSVRFAGALEANAPGKGAGFFLNQGGAFDLARFQAVTGGAFTGHVAIRTGTGDLALAAGQTLKADNVFLTADGGRIDLAGAIDVSGVNGGDVRLIGADGVLLRTGSKIDARAEGYGDDATRVAEGGSVLIGTSQNGAIRVEAGAAIDVGAARGQARLVETRENGVTNYRLVEADRGGSLTLRAPVVEAGGLQTVNVSFAGAVTGADSVTVEGYKAYDLGEIAVGGQFSGVTISNGVATLDLAATGKPNFLADTTAGTLADFIRRFDISAAYGQLGGLASAANFHARPGVELNYAGDLVLSSNWNLAAGVVNVSGAVSAGLMALHPSLAGAYYVKPGSEGALLADYADMTYRVGGKASGEAGVLTLRAGGDLTLKGSITDGYFTFGDQTDPAYLNTVLGGGSKVYNGSVNGACVGSCATIGAYTPTGSPTNVISVTFPGASALSSQLVASGNPAPYRAAANSAAALGSGLNGAGDAVASADLFPLIETASGQRAVHSSSYQLVAGAARDNSGAFSADPTRTQAGSDASLSLDGRGAYSYGGVAGTTAFSDTLLFGTANGQRVTAEAWLQAQLAANPAFTVNSYTRITFSAAPAAVSAFLSQNARAYFAQFPGRYTLTGPANAPTGVSTTLELAAGFLKLSANSWSTLKTSYTPPRPTAAPPLTTVQTAALIRTGTGSIELSAAGAIDLRNGQDAVYRNLTTGAVTSATSGYQVGGAAVYTAGHRVLPRQVLVADPATGEILQLDPTAYSQPDPRLTNYGYGAGSGGGAGLAGLLEAETVYAEGGGDVSLTAGGDVLGRRDAYGAARIGANGNQLRDLAFVGSMTQPWRVGQVGEITDIRINNKLFAEGVGTLGGGDVMVAAGGQVVDLSIVADTSVTTADVGGRTGRALLTFGGGDVSIKVGGDLLGGRIDIGRGDGDIVVGGDIAAAGRAQFDAAAPSALTDNGLRLRLTDAQIRIAALGDAAIQGITALGVGDINRIGFYSGDSGVSILAGGSVTVANPSLNTGVGDVVSNGGDPSSLIGKAIYPTSFSAVALAGDLSLGSNIDRQILLYPSARGTLTLAAGGDVAATTIAMLDIDPGLTPGAFSSYRLVGNELVGGKPFAFPAVLPSTSLAERLQLHASSLPHAGDATPNRVHAGGDIDGMIISTPKLTRISAGQDIVDMMFFGQNLGSTDITRIVAGRDITATTTLRRAVVDYVNGAPVMGPLLPTLNGGAFVIGGPGHLFLEAGRDLGPFLNSATDVFNPLIQSNTQQAVFGGGVLSVGAEWNPWLGAQGASVVTAFGVAKGADYASLRETYLNPANAANWPDHLYVNTPDSNDVLTPDKSKPIYAPLLSAWMQANHPDALPAGAADYAKTYAAFSSLPELQQRVFLLKVYHNELTQTSVPGPSYLKYSRGYTAVNTLFSAKLGYTANDLSGGSNGANQTVRTGDLDLRLSTIQTARGGDISILGPGGRVLAGSTVSTAQQAARRNYFGRDLFSGVVSNGLVPAQTSYLSEVPSGFEGVLTLRGGGVYTFTDGDFVLNQSRLFTEQGGDIAMWSSNGDLNAGQGPKTSANFPPAVVKVSDNAYAELDQANAVSGAGIAAFQPAPGVEAPNVYLIAPRGTVDAGDAGVRVAGNLFVAALSVANADNFSVQGSAIGVPTTSAAPTVSNEASAASSAAEKAAQATAQARPRDERSIISVQVLGFGDKECDDPARRDDKTCRP